MRTYGSIVRMLQKKQKKQNLQLLTLKIPMPQVAKLLQIARQHCLAWQKHQQETESCELPTKGTRVKTKRFLHNAAGKCSKQKHIKNMQRVCSSKFMSIHFFMSSVAYHQGPPSYHLGAAAQIAHHEKVHGEICLSVVENLRRKKWFQESSGKMNVNLLKVRTASNLFDIQMHISVGGCSFSSVSRFQELN